MVVAGFLNHQPYDHTHQIESVHESTGVGPRCLPHSPHTSKYVQIDLCTDANVE